MSKDAEGRSSKSPAVLSRLEEDVVVFLAVLLDGLESCTQAGSRGSLLAQTQTQNPDPRARSQTLTSSQYTSPSLPDTRYSTRSRTVLVPAPPTPATTDPTPTVISFASVPP